jgi:hypothetical protein
MLGGRVVAVGTAVLIGAAGCAAPEAGGGAEDPVLSVHLTQYREDEARRIVQVTVTNQADTGVRVQDLRLDAAGYAPTATTRRETDITPGARVDLPVSLGPARCGTPSGVGDATVLARVAADRQRPRDLTVRLGRRDALLERLYAQDCRRETLARAVRIEFGDEWARTARGLAGTIVLQRLAASTVTVTELGGSVIFELRLTDSAPGLPLRLDAATPRLELPIELWPVRCDGHSLGESKNTYVFRLWVGVDGKSPEFTSIGPTPSARQRIDAMLREQCDRSR